MDIAIKVNGRARELSVEPRVTLVDALRDELGLTGTKKGCDRGECGACTVHVDGRRVLSCLTLAVMADGRRGDHGRGSGRAMASSIRCSARSGRTTRSSAGSARPGR